MGLELGGELGGKKIGNYRCWSFTGVRLGREKDGIGFGEGEITYRRA